MDDPRPPRKRQRLAHHGADSDLELIETDEDRTQEAMHDAELEAEASSWALVDAKATLGPEVSSSAASAATMAISDTSPKALTPVPARWCGKLENDRYHWDDSKITNLISPEECEDGALLQDIVHGLKLTCRLHPLVFEDSSEDADEKLKLRSLSFFQQILNSDDGEAIYRKLDREQKKTVGLGVRDLYLAGRKGLLTEPEKQILDGMVRIMDEGMGRYQLPGINVSAHPSANYSMLKLVEASGIMTVLAEKWSPYFAQVIDTPPLFAVFVNPAELSYHNFENIVPLDRWIEAKGDPKPDGEAKEGLSLSFTELKQVKRGYELWTCGLQGASCDLIKQIPSLDLYVQPLNKQTRGGERFIFQSAMLSRALTGAVRAGDLLDHLTRGKSQCSFEFVNYVFRCNKFAPGQAVFSSHRDTPYYDRERRHVSKYTLLIYLSAGRGEPALKVKDVDWHNIQEMTCVIFDQSYEHEGHPFIDGDKIFLRTELIFKDTGLKRDIRIAPLFSQACYMSGQSLLDESLAGYAHECFERANSLHWAVEQEAAKPPVYLRKQFRGICFITNGYDYWFAKAPGIALQDAAVIAVLDYFNCKISDKAFRSLSRTSTLDRKFRSSDEILALLHDSREDDAAALRRLSDKDVDSLIKREPTTPFFKREASWEDDEGFDNEDQDDADGENGEDGDDVVGCCPFHAYKTYDAWGDPDVEQVYNQCWDFTRKKLFEAPVLLLDQEVIINDGSIKVSGDKVFFLQRAGTDPLPPINFAACWNCDFGPADLIDIDGEVSAPKLLIPPIMFDETELGFHLVLDFFRNDWMVKVDEKHTIPLPIITNDLDVFEGEGTFVERLDAFTEYNHEHGLKIMEDHWALKR